MFERYNEKARRTIFFARCEASNYGSAYIETEHILLGLIRESRWLFNKVLPNLDGDAIRGEIKPRSDKKIATSVDLPLSDAAKSVLTRAAEEAARLNDRHIGCEHLLLGLMREPDHPAAQLLSKHGATLPGLRLEVAKLPRMDAPLKIYNIPPKRFPRTAAETVELHGVRWNLEYIHERVAHLTQYSWYWQKLS